MKENLAKKGSSHFDLIGRAKVNQYTYQMDNKSDSGYIHNKINLGVDCGEGNVVYSELMGGYNPEKNYPIYVHGKTTENGKDKDDFYNQFQVAWEDRHDISILKTIGEGCFIRVTLESDEKGKLVTEKFLSGYDAIKYVKDNLLDGDIIEVRGAFEHSYYSEDVVTRKKIKSIYLKKDTPVEGFKSNFTQTFLLTSDSLSKKPTENKTLEVFGYVVDYLGKYDGVDIKQNVLFPKKFEIDLTKYNQTQIEAQIKTFFTVKKGWFAELTVEGHILEGATTASMSIDDLPENMKNLVVMGIISVEDAISKVVTGTRDRRLIWEKPLATQGALQEDGTRGMPKIYHTAEKYRDGEVMFVAEAISVPFETKPTSTPVNTSPKPVSAPVVAPVLTDEADIDLSFLFSPEEV